ncbi:M23 family peptidase [Geitlerinema sp. P-1104]|uniref:M23 family metallopeptidase n=1 Tax=Geitlerinema sp. P-1104 TaxID=2546230 RepID=UPI0014775FBF|nr:peptidoglycan DD-metalloendopeptidase family protein [Geitlerinema sp. P-1104]NMG57827.1 M23 family peptidase [Geitlerinema sp. P-1104]
MQKRSTHTHLSLSLLGQGLGWLGSLSLFGSSLVFAKGPYNPDLHLQQKVPDYSPNPVDSTPDYAPEPVAPSQTYSPEPAPIYQEPAAGYQDNTYQAPVEAPVEAPRATPEPEPAPESHQGVSPDAVFENQPQREAIAPPEPLNRPQLDRPNLSPQHSYIDETDYSLGATTAQDSQVVVFEERSTGCEARVSGRVSGQLCNPRPAQSQPSPGNSLPQPQVASGSPAPSQPGGGGQGAVTYRPGPASAPSGFSASSQSSGGAQVANNANRPPSVNVDYAQMRAQLLRDMAVQPLERSFRARDRRLIFPLSIPAPISSFFGWRHHPIAGVRRFHAGTDIAAPTGTPVLAAFSGKVATAEMLGGYGLTVILEHNQGTAETLYAHLSQLLVRPGQEVRQGQVIGRVGNTGYSTGPHLHFEVKQLTEQGWVHLDPGLQLELALEELINQMQVARASEGD